MDSIDIADLDDLQNPIEVRIGPSKSSLIQEMSAQYGKYQSEEETKAKGMLIVLHFTSEDRYELWDLLHKTGRIRSAVVIHGNERFDATSYRDNFLCNFICHIRNCGVCQGQPQASRWELPTNCERLWEGYIVPVLTEGPTAIKKAYLEGMKDLSLYRCGRLDGRRERENIEWIIENLEEGLGLIPESAFLSLAFHIGDWEGVEKGRPLMPESRRQFLKIFTGSRIEPSVMNMAQKVSAEFSKRQNTDERLILYEVAERLNVPHYDIEESVQFVLSLNRSVSARNDTKPLGGLVYVSGHREACDVCSRLYLNPGTDVPRLFYFDELTLSTANADKELSQWTPALPPLHLRCFCSLMRFTGCEPWASQKDNVLVTRLPSLELRRLQDEK